MNKVYPTEIEAVNEMNEKIYTLTLQEENVYHIHLNTIITKDYLPELVTTIRKGIELMEIEW